MENTTVNEFKLIKENQFGYNEPTPILAISQDIETLKLSETYDQFGQKVGTYNTGDSVELLSDYALYIAQKVSGDQEAGYKFSVGSVINGYDHSDVFDEIRDELSESDLIVDQDYAEYYQTCKGFNYWDGSNWKTVTVEAETGETSHEIVHDSTDYFEKAIENMEFVRDSHGKNIYESPNFWIVESYLSDAFEKYCLYPKEYFTLEQLY